MRSSSFTLASLFCVVSLAACAGTEPTTASPNQYAASNGQYSGTTGQYDSTGQATQTGQYGQTGQYQPASQTTPAATTTATTAASPWAGLPAIPGLGQPAASTGSTATPIAFASVLTPAIQLLAASEAQGMTADGQAFAGQFQEGQTLEQALTIQAGKCYTVLATSAGTISQLDITLVLEQSPLPAVVLAQGSGATAATIGGKSSGCFKNSLPVGGPGKVVLKATRGGGIAGAQVFSK